MDEKPWFTACPKWNPRKSWKMKDSAHFCCPHLLKTTVMMVPPPWRMFVLPLDGSAWVKDPRSVSTHHITGIPGMMRTLHAALFKPDTKDIEYIASFLLKKKKITSGTRWGSLQKQEGADGYWGQGWLGSFPRTASMTNCLYLKMFKINV